MVAGCCMETDASQSYALGDGANDAASDAEIVALVLSGDREAFSVLAGRYAGPLAALAFDRLGGVLDAQDMVQEALIIAFKRLGTLRHPGRFGSWVYEILRNLCSLHIRRRVMERAYVRRAANNPIRPESETLPLDQALANERMAFLRDAVADLPPALREAVMVRYLGDTGRREAASILSISRKTFDKRIERALRKLRERLEEANLCPHTIDPPLEKTPPPEPPKNENGNESPKP